MSAGVQPVCPCWVGLVCASACQRSRVWVGRRSSRPAHARPWTALATGHRRRTRRTGNGSRCAGGARSGCPPRPWPRVTATSARSCARRTHRARRRAALQPRSQAARSPHRLPPADPLLRQSTSPRRSRRNARPSRGLCIRPYRPERPSSPFGSANRSWTHKHTPQPRSQRRRLEASGT